MQKKTELNTVVDKLIKLRAKDNELPKKKFDGKEVVDMAAFLHYLLKDNQSSCLPETIDHCEALMVLSSSHMYEKTTTFSYNKSFKYACDIDHPSIGNVPKILDISEHEAHELIQLIKNYNGSVIDYYHLFKNPKDDTDLSVFSKEAIIEKIDGISKDSTHGTIVSHPAKMTHPDLKYPRIFFDKVGMKADGYVRTGNGRANFDLHINATQLKVFKFLSLLIDGKPIFEVIKAANFRLLAKQFQVTEEKAREWIDRFKQSLFTQDKKTHPLVKQVYFPVENSYHQLSILQPSGLIFSLKDKIDDINHRSEQAFLGRKAKHDNAFYGPGFSTCLNLTITRHGGEHPKNISALNNKYQTYYLLDSSPPYLEKRDIKFPTKDFFRNSIRFFDIQEPLRKLDGIFKTGLGGDIPRRNLESGRDHRIEEILDLIIQRMVIVRSVASEQYREESSYLPVYQKIWLCNEFQEERKKQDKWLNDLCEDVLRWIVAAYKKVVKKPVALGPAEINYLKEMIETHREVLR